MKKRIIFILVIPLSLILSSIYALNKFNKNKIKTQFEKITIAEGVTIRNFIEVAGQYLMEEREEELTKFLNSLYENEWIVYIGLFEGDDLIYLLSRFEGYFPIMENQPDSPIIDSPIGKIFNITGIFRNKNETSFKLHIGFNYEFLYTFETAASRNFLLMAGLFTFIILFITILIIYFDKKFFQKELELEREKQEKDRFKELSLLTSEIAHEIKNPLNSIYLSFNALEKFLDSQEEAFFYRDSIKGEIKRITAIIQSYSDLSKEIHARIETVDIGQLATEFQWMMEGELKKNKAVLTVHLEENIVFKTDGNLFKQILLNLAKNSIEAGAALITLTISLNKKRLALIFNDDGKGIDRIMASNIFKPYVSSKTKGMGLGLHIIWKILKALNGNIQLVSRLPGNTTFKIEIPE